MTGLSPQARRELDALDPAEAAALLNGFPQRQLWAALFGADEPYRACREEGCDRVCRPWRVHCSEEACEPKPYHHWLGDPTVRVADALAANEVTSLEGLLQWTPLEVTAWDRFGPVSWRQLGRLLDALDDPRGAEWWVPWDDARGVPPLRERVRLPRPQDRLA